MDAVPKMFEVEDSTALDASLQEESQSTFLNSILFTPSVSAKADVVERIRTTFRAGEKRTGFDGFVETLAEKICGVKDAFAKARKESKEVPQIVPEFGVATDVN